MRPLENQPRSPPRVLLPGSSLLAAARAAKSAPSRGCLRMPSALILAACLITGVGLFVGGNQNMARFDLFVVFEAVGVFIVEVFDFGLADFNRIDEVFRTQHQVVYLAFFRNFELLFVLFEVALHLLVGKGKFAFHFFG